jgi:hypothetical protein
MGDSFTKYIIRVTTESFGAMLVLGLLVGGFNYAVRYVFQLILVKFGIETALQIQESWQWIANKITMSMEKMNSDRCVYYSIQNGTPYFDNFAYQVYKTEMSMKILNKLAHRVDADKYFLGKKYNIISQNCNKRKTRGISPMPNKLDHTKFMEFIIDVIDHDEQSHMILRADLKENSHLRNTLFDYGIEGCVVTKIMSDNNKKLYGFVIHTYSDIKQMPKNTMVSMEEHLKDLRSFITFEVEEINSISYWENVKRNYRMLINRLRILKIK